jgi:hypothetical protein
MRFDHDDYFKIKIDVVIGCQRLFPFLCYERYCGEEFL